LTAAGIQPDGLAVVAHRVADTAGGLVSGRKVAVEVRFGRQLGHGLRIRSMAASG